MGQNSSCSCADQQIQLNESDFIDLPLVTKEDVHHLKACFEYLQPENGVVNRKSIQVSRHQAPVYMTELIDALDLHGSDVTFNEFYRIMKPKVIQMKALPQDSVVVESTTTSVSCIICPYKRQLAAKP